MGHTMNRIVKVNSNRGLTDEMFEVISSTDQEYCLKGLTTGIEINLYKAHCYENFNTKKASHTIHTHD